MQRTSLVNNLVHCRSNAPLLGHICMDGEKFFGGALGESVELVSCVTNVERVDAGCIIGEAGLGDTETNATVRSGDYVYGLEGIGICRMTHTGDNFGGESDVCLSYCVLCFLSQPSSIKATLTTSLYASQ